MTAAVTAESPELRQAIRQMRVGGWLGVAVSCIGVLLSLFLAASAPIMHERAAFFADPAVLLDMALVFVLSIGVLRRSRFCAVALIVIYVVGRLVVGFSEVGQASFNLISLVVLFFFVRAALEAFTYHRLVGARAPRWRRWAVAGIGAPVVGLYLLTGAFSIASVTGLIPTTDVVSAERLPDRLYRDLIAIDVLGEDETLLYAYSPGVFSMREEGAVLTTEEVRVYERTPDGSIWISGVPLTEVGDVLPIAPGGFADDAVFLVHDRAGDERFYLFLSTEAQGHQRFINTLRRLAPQDAPGPPVIDGRGLS